MPYVLGIDIGGTCTTAAVSRLRDGMWSQPEIVRLGTQSCAVPSVLHMSANGSFTVGDPGQHGATLDGGRTVRDFARRIGDDVPLVVAGETCTPQALTAVLAMWVVERVLAEEGVHPDQVVLSHPAGWGPYRRELLHEALWDIGLTNVRLLPEPVMAAESHASRGFAAGTLGVYALGVNNFEASVVRRAHPGGFEVLACMGGVEPLGGADFDEALVNHVRAHLRRELEQLDPADPHVRLALSGLRRECARAKEKLTVADQTDVIVQLPQGQTRVPVSRAQFEDLIRPPLQVTVDTLTRTVRSCGLQPHQIDGILLMGGSSRIPLVAELVAARFPGPVAVEADPEVTAAAGAALVACQLVAPHRGTRPDHAWMAPPAPRPPLDDSSPLPEQDLHRREDEILEPPPRPPVKITPLDLPRMRVSRLVSGRSFGIFGLGAVLALLMMMVAAVLTFTAAPDASISAPTAAAPNHSFRLTGRW